MVHLLLRNSGRGGKSREQDPSGRGGGAEQGGRKASGVVPRAVPANPAEPFFHGIKGLSKARLRKAEFTSEEAFRKCSFGTTLAEQRCYFLNAINAL